MSEPAKQIPLFVYGTLREGGGLHAMIENALLKPPQRATASGYQLYANRSATYPFMVPEPGQVIGDLLIVNNSRQLDNVVAMEIGAGYDMEAVTIETESGDTGIAIGFVLNVKGEFETGRWLGEHIQSGDWIDWTSRNRKYRKKYDWTVWETPDDGVEVDVEKEGWVETFPANRATIL